VISFLDTSFNLFPPELPFQESFPDKSPFLLPLFPMEFVSQIFYSIFGVVRDDTSFSEKDSGNLLKTAYY